MRVLGPTRFAVTRELFTRARMNPSGVTRGARFKPQEKDGRALGLQVFRLRADSLLAHLGVKQGDVLRGINGHTLSSADGVLEAFGHLGKDPRISLVVERAGQRTTIEYVLE
jgi:general secretion pathway protein C